MEGFVAQKLNDFETGKISRRKLIETLTAAATTAYATGAAAQGEESPLKAQLINHISYTCPDFKRAADWYSKVFNLDQVGQTQRDVVLPFGKKGEQPYGVTAKDVPLAHLIIRTPNPNAPPPRGGAAGRIGGGGGERQRLDQPPAADLAGLELIELVSNEPFHDGLPYCPRRNASSSTMLANWTS